VSLERPGRVPCRLVGWSFPTKRVAESPLTSLPRGLAESGTATLGVLHCDLDASGSDYAPVGSAELAATGFDAWLLGHVHKPHPLNERPVGYLGSMTGLDAGEPGAHGPWLVEVGGPGDVRATHVPLAPIRYETVEVGLGSVRQSDRADLEDDFDGRIRRALDTLHARLEAEGAVGPNAAGLVVCRVRVRGAERHVPDVRRAIFDPRFEGTHRYGGTAYVIEKVVEPARPDFDLDALARRVDAPGLLAARLVALRDGTEAARPLLARARQKLADETGGGRFGQLDALPWETPGEGDAELVDLLLRSGTRELEGLLAQKPEAGEAAP
jgi:hypothetical protein